MSKTIAKVISVLIIIGAFIEGNLSIFKELGFSENLIMWIRLVGLLISGILPSITGLFNEEKK